jgi:outer membrane protein assembly factor BamD
MMRSVALAAVLLSLAACGAKPINYEEASVEVIYNDALKSLDERAYKAAAARFEEVERQHPYSVWARRAILMASYSYYMSNRYSDAIIAAERYIGLHPGTPEVAYAYYLKAMCYYEQITDVGRDQQTTEEAMKALDAVVRRFPNTEYARDARLKLDMTRDHLAGKELAIGRFYLVRQQYVAAINRFRHVIEEYQTTSQVPEALHRLTEAYLALGIEREAQTAAAVLGYNYPGSDWYQDSYKLLAQAELKPQEDKGSWISRAWHQVF